MSLCLYFFVIKKIYSLNEIQGNCKKFFFGVKTYPVYMVSDLKYFFVCINSYNNAIHCQNQNLLKIVARTSQLLISLSSPLFFFPYLTLGRFQNQRESPNGNIWCFLAWYIYVHDHDNHNNWLFYIFF